MELCIYNKNILNIASRDDLRWQFNFISRTQDKGSSIRKVEELTSNSKAKLKDRLANASQLLPASILNYIVMRDESNYAKDKTVQTHPSNSRNELDLPKINSKAKVDDYHLHDKETLIEQLELTYNFILSNNLYSDFIESMREEVSCG